MAWKGGHLVGFNPASVTDPSCGFFVVLVKGIRAACIAMSCGAVHFHDNVDNRFEIPVC